MKKVLDLMKRVGGLILPMFARARDVRSLSPAVRWTLHFVVLGLVLVALSVIFNVTGLKDLISPGTGLIRTIWPSLFALSLYVLCWLGWWIYQILMEPPPASQFPDIDSAWEEALKALDNAGIDPTDVPLFLVLGRPEGPEEGLFDASQIPMKVSFAPKRAEAPLHVYANREGIYVTCAGASTLGFQAALLAGEAELAAPSAKSGSKASPERFEESSTMNFDTSGFEGRTNDPREIDKWIKIKEILNRARASGRGPADLTPEELRELERLGEEAGTSGERKLPILTENGYEYDRCLARLRHFCRLVVRDRRPYCPINGILLLIPLQATDDDKLANAVASCVQDDLATAQDELRVNCPIISMMCDLERVPGYAELTERLPKQALSQRMGQRFPFAPEVPFSEIPTRIEGAIRHIGDAFFPNLVSSLWRIEDTSDREEAVTQDNTRLFRFLSEIRERQRRLARILARGLPRDLNEGPLMFGGCYLAGTRREPGVTPAFVRGVFQRIAKQHEDVSWTRAALDDDAKCDRWAGLGYLTVGSLAAAFVVVAALLLTGTIGSPDDGTAAESSASSSN